MFTLYTWVIDDDAIDQTHPVNNTELIRRPCE
jgi:hypothetical protein